MDRAPSSVLALAPPSTTEEHLAMTGELDAAFRSYARYVAAVALRLLGRDDELDDVVQEVFLIAVRGLGRLREPEAVKGWLATVTVRVAGRRLRRRRLRALVGLDRGAGYEEIAASGASQEERALLGRVYRVLDGMPVKERLAWLLRHVEGERLEAVAELCGCSLATAKRRIAAAQKILDEALRDE
jgi:RNA polymerase sigma-70 factor (ECF subfamily)